MTFTYGWNQPNRVMALVKVVQGQWTWVLLRGKGTLRCIVLTLHRVVMSSGDLSAYQHRQRALENLDNDTRCPRKASLLDLEILVNDWRLKRFQIIIMDDLIGDVIRKAERTIR